MPIHRPPTLLDLNTYTVKTRRGYHYYFATGDQFIRSRKSRGLDLQAEGRYVVAPPHPDYEIVDPRPPRAISRAELYALFDQFRQSPSNPIAPTGSPDPMPSLTAAAHRTPSNRSTDSAIQLYERRAAEIGSRNTALFLTACQLRDEGQTQSWVVGALALTYTRTPALHDHPRESEAARQREAAATIRSAYSRPPRARVQMQPDNVTRIATSDNAARELMLQADQTAATAFWRCYDGLIIAGLQPGDRFTHDSAYGLLSALGIGHRALDRFVRAVSSAGECLIPPAPRTPPPAVAATMVSTLSDKNAFVHTTKRSENHRGRPPTVYTLPSLEEICQRLGVQRSPGDPITAQDVTSPRQYRASLEREFIRRRPGRYSLGLLATRIGVDGRTIQRYHQAESVPSAPTFETICQIAPGNLDLIPCVERGKASKFFLEDSTGRLYPPRKESAEYALLRGRAVYLKARGYNYYWYGAPPVEAAPVLTPALSVEDSYAAWSERIRQRGEAISQLLYEREIAQLPDPIVPFPPITRPTLPSDPPSAYEHARAPDTPPAPVRRKPKRYYHQALPDAQNERLAQRVSTWTKTNDQRHGMSIYNARRLVETYTYRAVEIALNTISGKFSRCIRGEIRNPAGLIVCEAKGRFRELYGDQQITPRFEVEKRRSSRAQRQRPDAETEYFWLSITWLILINDPGYMAWRKEFFTSINQRDPFLEGGIAYDEPPF